jgi:hypothetical protein
MNDIVFPALIFLLAKMELHERISTKEKAICRTNSIFLTLNKVILPLFGFATIYTLLEFFTQKDEVYFSLPHT